MCPALLYQYNKNLDLTWAGLKQITDVKCQYITIEVTPLVITTHTHTHTLLY